jgi:hypothetical protein
MVAAPSFLDKRRDVGRSKLCRFHGAGEFYERRIVTQGVEPAYQVA